MKRSQSEPATGNDRFDPNNILSDLLWLPGSGLRTPAGYAQEMRKRPPGSPTLIQRILERRAATARGGSDPSAK